MSIAHHIPPSAHLSLAVARLRAMIHSYTPEALCERLGINPPQAPDSDSRTETDQQPHEGTHVR